MSFRVARAIVFEVGKDRFLALTVNLRTNHSVIETKFQSSCSRYFGMLRCQIHFQKLPRRSGCYVVTSVSISFQDPHGRYIVTSIPTNFQDALDATLEQPFLATSKTLWMLGCNAHSK